MKESKNRAHKEWDWKDFKSDIDDYY